MKTPNDRIELEAEPFDPHESDGQGPRSSPRGRSALLGRMLSRPYGMILAGAMLDAVDFTTFGPLAIVGFPIGCLCGLWLAGQLGYPKRLRLAIAAGCGLYCMFPPTTLLPVATVLGLLARHLGVAPDQQQ